MKKSPSTTKHPFGKSADKMPLDALDIKIQELSAQFEELGWIAVVEPFENIVNKKEGLTTGEQKLLLIDYLTVYLGYKKENSQTNDLNLVMQVQEKIMEARTDILTGIENRKAFEEKLKVVKGVLSVLDSERRRNKSPSSALIAFDLNGFKGINDTYGHLAGDEALKHFTAIVSEVPLRREDGFYRTGGDEFHLILSGGDVESAEIVIANIKAKLSRNPFVWEGKKIFLKTSAGAADILLDKALTASIEEADKGMYDDKDNNRPGGASIGGVLSAPSV